MPTAKKDPALDVPPELHEAWTAHKEIVKYGTPVLRQIAHPVKRVTRDTHELIERMEKVMRGADGLGLAAPQIGVSERVLVYDAGEGLRVLINPKIVSMRGEQLDPPEGCLSIPLLQGDVKRANEVIVKATDILGRPLRRRATEYEARIIQHEIDHLDGVLFIERADLETLHWLVEGEEPEEGV